MKIEIDEIISNLSKFKGLTKKNSERLVVDLIEHPDKVEALQREIRKVQTLFHICPICYGLTINEQCEICANPSRNQKIVCVVSSIMDMLNIEKFQKYKGVYAVLGGEINVQKGMTPDKLAIDSLLHRLKTGDEVILALNATFEGEVTANYIAKLLQTKKVKITRIAKGIPMGGMIDYMDEATLESALINRKKVEED
ncbi:DNA replication and repair protein RecR [Entomoplasma freundtii]|uniref:Recombination protein RecR n=1 Tax=Entomoplasma freundtii TaxID=74700 RepID=A0A2K8NVE8_9MOLU|nr:recombination mediator RecR [Entomoplasma freundtii]ATZ16721.1 recombination protein RecR [Entomoplasma freundtii]TDY58112.1 DNA replication and repair protein RecR [Entomoplasma freundtii]